MSEFTDAITKAVEIGTRMSVRGSTATYSHGIAMSNLRTAELWAQQDEKEQEEKADRLREMTE